MSCDGSGATFSRPEPMTGVAPYSNVWAVPHLRRMSSDMLILTSGRSTIGLWVCTDGKGELCSFINLARAHNLLYPPCRGHADSKGEGEVITNAYTSHHEIEPNVLLTTVTIHAILTSFHCTRGRARRRATALVYVRLIVFCGSFQYDRTCNGGGYPPGPFGNADMVVSWLGQPSILTLSLLSIMLHRSTCAAARVRVGIPMLTALNVAGSSAYVCIWSG